MPRALIAALALCLPLCAQDEPTLDATNSISLFDGKTLKGWTAKGGRYDGTARWTVEEGELIGRQGPNRSGGLLYTVTPFADFIFSCETSIDWPFDSGIFVRMVPRAEKKKGAQVTLDVRPGGEVGAIYSDGFLLHNKEGVKQWKKDGWNKVTVRCVGATQKLTVWLNGKRLTEHELESAEGYARTGLLGVQVHGGPSTDEATTARFRNMFLRELPPFDTADFTCDDHGRLKLTEVGQAAGWKDLLGSALDQWDMAPGPEAYALQDGVLAVRSGGGGGLTSKMAFGDFRLRMDFRLQKMANSGLYMRRTESHQGIELQILDDHHWEEVSGTKLTPYQFSGGLYHQKAPDVTTALRPIGHWNTYEVIAKGNTLTVTLNGELIQDAVPVQLDEKYGGALPARGKLFIQRYGSKWTVAQPYMEVRNLFLRSL